MFPTMSTLLRIIVTVAYSIIFFLVCMIDVYVFAILNINVV